MLVRQNLRVSLNVSVQRKNMQRYCGGCLRDERKWFLNKVETFLKERVRRVNHV